MATLTGKPRPRICYLPTAYADSPDRQHQLVPELRAARTSTPFVQESFIASAATVARLGGSPAVDGRDRRSGGNTLNQQAIWKAQGIDAILRQAWDRGIVLGGASAGSLCWFEEGTTDSRPKELSTVQCLGLPQGQPFARTTIASQTGGRCIRS